MTLLHWIGFEEQILPDGERLLVVSQEPTTSLLQTAQDLLETLQNRAAPHFVAELAPPPPWQAPIQDGGRWQNSQAGRTRFVTDEEKWARVERVNRNRRSGRGRRPEPGQAPSSRGKWGR